MKRALLSAFLACAAMLLSPLALAQEEKAPAKLLRAAVAIDENTRPATTFSRKVPQLVIFYVGDNVKVGQKVRGVWIAEDIGTVAPKNHKIAEDTLDVSEENQTGSFTLSKPDNGWPVGKYRAELYVDDKLAETLKFEIKAEE